MVTQDVPREQPSRAQGHVELYFPSQQAVPVPAQDMVEPLNLAQLSPYLVQDARGIWTTTQPRDAVSYDPQDHDTLFAIEDKSYWFAHRNAVIEALVRAYPVRPNGVLLDVGAGNGFVARMLAQHVDHVVALEDGPAGVHNARSRGLPHVVHATLAQAGFVSGSFSAVGLFDVLEHCANDTAVLQQLHACLEPRGRLFLTVPAYPWLWSDEDQRAGHHRRYTLAQLTRVVSQAGFRVETTTGFFRPLVLPVALLRALPSHLGWRSNGSSQSTAREHGANPGFVTKQLKRVLAYEAVRIGQGARFGWGASLALVAQRV